MSKENLYPAEKFSKPSAWNVSRGFLLDVERSIKEAVASYSIDSETFCRVYRVLIEMEMEAGQLAKLLREKFPEYKEALKRFIEKG